MQNVDTSKPLLAVVGETASGKSALAMDLARQFDGELICADSWTVYRGFDIGAAKPTLAEQAEIRHHVLNVAEPDQGFSAVRFQELANLAIKDIRTRGKIPILVGGTGLYIDSVLYDYQFLPAPSDTMREELNGLSLQELLQKTEEHNLDTTGIDLRNKRRLIRLIENNGQRPNKGNLRDDAIILGIQADREHLRDRIERRVDIMLEQGLKAEVAALAQRYGWDVEAMKGIGYREWRPYFEPKPELHQDLEQTRQRIISSTMGLAKRQRTWFKRNQRIHWLSEPNKLADAVDIVTTISSK